MQQSAAIASYVSEAYAMISILRVNLKIDLVFAKTDKVES
jgi:hypothetical protein